MTPDEAIEIVTKLAEGVDPYTGQRLPSESVYQQADTVRALYVALDGLAKLKRAHERQKSLPTGAGRTWTEDEEQEVLRRFDAKEDVAEIARDMNRTTGAIWSRLEKLGRIKRPAFGESSAPRPRPPLPADEPVEDDAPF